MILNNENYYSPEANQEYMSVSQYKAFMNCEAAAMASISGKYERPTTRALLVTDFQKMLKLSFRMMMLLWLRYGIR